MHILHNVSKSYAEIVCIYIFVYSNSKTDAQDHGRPVTDFGNLELNARLLKGSRWAIEQEMKNEKIAVYFTIEIVDISKVDVDTMSVRLEIYLRQRWEADELKLPDNLFQPTDPPTTFITAPPTILDSIWSPDPFIPVARETKIASFTVSQAVVNIYKNKTIIHKTRMYTIIGCNFEFQWYPLDKQTCNLTIESFTYTSNQVMYLWEDKRVPVIVRNLKLFQYDINLPMQYSNGTASRWGVTANYPYILLRFTFERRIGNNLIQVFTPTILVVILSWFSFWLGLDAIPGRVSLLITCMLTLVTMHTGLKESVPPVNYIKMMDIWMVSCMAFVFAAMCEFVVVKYLHWKTNQKLKAKEEQELAMAKYVLRHPKMQKKISNNNERQMGPNTNLEFYRNMNAHLLNSENHHLMETIPKRRSDAPKAAWQDFERDPEIIGPPEIFYYPYQNQMKAWRNPEDDWPFVPKKRPIWVIIDRVSRVVFPMAFGIFNAIYWPLLIIGASNQ